VSVVARLRYDQCRGAHGGQRRTVGQRHRTRQRAQGLDHRRTGQRTGLPADPDLRGKQPPYGGRLLGQQQLGRTVDIIGLETGSELAHPALRGDCARTVDNSGQEEHQPGEALRLIGDEAGQRTRAE